MQTPCVYYLPKSARQLVITYLANDIAVSIVCPDHEKKINVNFVSNSGRVYAESNKIKVPELYLTHLLYKDQFLLHTHQNGKFAPYLLANVYEYGVICFGDVFDHCPKDLRQAWNYYWESPFNQENSEYYDYHKNKCVGVSQHTYAGHRQEDRDTCICACCIEICNCPCFCLESQLFNQYLTEYSQKKFQFCAKPSIVNDNSLRLDIQSSQLVVIPQKLANLLGLKDNKYPDIFLFVLREDDTHFHCAIDQQQLPVPKAWFKNGTK
jgi:hypothetical protein